MTRRLTAMFLLLMLLVIGATSIVASASGDEGVWFCSSDASTGFFKKDGRWAVSRFEDAKFKLKFGETVGEYTSIELRGERIFQWHRCWQNELFKSVDRQIDTFYCGDDYGHYFSINRATGNFMLSNTWGWLDDTAKDKTNDTVSFERGTCTKF